jgi:AraC-like DNA-binding protein
MVATALVQSKGSVGLIGGQKHQTVIRFKQLVQAHYKALKQVQAYASQLHITPLYLNEIVKEITGFPASHWIHQEIMLEAKRLLYYTDLDVKQIAGQCFWTGVRSGTGPGFFIHGICVYRFLYCLAVCFRRLAQRIFRVLLLWRFLYPYPCVLCIL